MGRKTKNVNITRIALEAGVSEATVSRVLNHRTNVGESTRRKVNAIARKYGFTPVSPSFERRKIGILVGEPNFNDYLSEVLNGIYQYALGNNLLEICVIFKTTSTGRSSLKRIRDQQCAGIIVIEAAAYDGIAVELADTELPVVFLDEEIHLEGIGFIDHDSYFGSRKATEHLLGLGHKKIAYIESGFRSSNHFQRLKAFENAMSEAGLTIRPEWIAKASSGDDGLQGGYDEMRRLLHDFPEITAVMTSNDIIATGAIKAVFDFGMRIPEDMSVIGFDNYKSTAFSVPALTTVNHPMREAGYLAVKHIDLYLKNGANETLPQTVLPTSLVIRDSVASPRSDAGAPP